MSAAAAAAAVAGGRRRISYMKETAIKQMETHIERASTSIQTGDIDNPRVYCKICMKLGSAIDSAIAVNAFPSSSHLPQILLIVKEVYRRKTELLQPSLMLLMLPIKAACQIGWFPDGDKDGLLMIVKEVTYGFSDTDKMSIEPSNAHSSVSNIVSRFYPTMKVEHILTSFNVKAGYGTFVADFHISLGTTPRNCRNLMPLMVKLTNTRVVTYWVTWLLVAQLDNMDTAACITGPLNVDFLINGSGVPNRTRNDVEKGPQLPSNITKMVKYGLNLLQVFGDFDGQYIIALAFMNTISSRDSSQLQNYLRPVSGVVDSGCDVKEMSSQISLYCPISQHRIETPVKGHLCKHPQCFDYNYFIEANSTKPTWECPLCNNPVCYQDIRVDQDFLKILNEVAKDVGDVIISEDGSWMVAETNKDTMSHTTVTTPAVSLGQTQVNVCTSKQAQSTTVFSPTAGSLGQTQVDVCTTNRAQSTTMFLPPAGSPGQTQVHACTTNQTQSTTMFSPPAVSPGQTQVNVCTTTQAQSTTMLAPPAGSPRQTQVNICKATQAKTMTKLTPPATVTKPAVSPAQTQVNVCTATRAQTTTASTPPAGSPGQTQVNVCNTAQTKSMTKLIPPPTVRKPAVSPGETQGNIYTTKQAQTTTMLAPPAASPGRTQVDLCTTNQAQNISMFTPPAAVTKPAVSPSQTQVNICTTMQAESTTMFTPPASSSPRSCALASNELRKGGKQGSCTTPGESQPANISMVSPTQLPEASSDAMPSGRMRGSLTGDRLEAARRQYLSPPQQPALANKPWSRPPIPSLPLSFLTPKTPATANSDNV